MTGHLCNIAIDAMGGDHAPYVVLDGLELFLRESKKFIGSQNVHFILFGDKVLLEELVLKTCYLKNFSTIVHTDEVVKNDTKPIVALRSFRKSSMALAVKHVCDAKADAVISCGNTGAYMAFSKVFLKTFSFVDRPAIPAIIPSLKDRTVVLDLGANVECSVENLVQFAILGDVYARSCLQLQAPPRVGLLNIGSENIKGYAILQEASNILSSIEHIHYHGFVEGNDITSGLVDVVVTDGFTGNVALKAIEGTAKLLSNIMKQLLSSNMRSKIGYLMAKPAFDQFRERANPSRYNGAVFLGLRHIAVKSHGGTDAVGFCCAIQFALNMIQKKLIEKIETFETASY